jgi:hypothetical protein
LPKRNLLSEYWSLLPPPLGENEIMHFDDSHVVFNDSTYIHRSTLFSRMRFQNVLCSKSRLKLQLVP